MNVYDNSVKLFEDFRSQYNLDKIWPVPLAHLVNFIVHLATVFFSKHRLTTVFFSKHLKNLFVWNRI